MSDRNRQVALFVKRYTEQQGYPPTVREVAEHIERSPMVAQGVLRGLIVTGYLTNQHGQPRTLVLTDKGKELIEDGND